MSEQERLFVLVYKGPNTQSGYYIVDLADMGNRDWLLKKLGLDSRIARLQKQIDQLQRSRHQIQRACLPQLVANCKEDVLKYIECNFPDKAFKSDPIRKEFDDWYGWEACVKAIDELQTEGKLTYKRGWYRLFKPVTEETANKEELAVTA